jgi:hypothetical protein
MKRLLTLAASLLLLAGCGANPIDTDVGVRISIVGNAHSRNGPVPFVVQNSTGAAIQIPACGGRARVIVERLENSAWTVVPDVPCGAGVSTAPVQVGSGGRVEGDRAITAAGQYRLRLVFTASGGSVSSFEVLSSEFQVT